LTGVKKVDLKRMLEILRGADAKKKAKGGRKSKLSNENIIGGLKRLKIINDRYRNRRKRFGLRFNLIAAIHNMELNQ
jgi:hypothetical protein